MIPYHSTPDTKFYVGNVLDVLPTLPEAHFHAVITSPPYWGHRDYGIEPTIWGDTDCEHEWEAEIGEHGHHDDGIVSSTLQGGKSTQAQTRYQPPVQSHCVKCGAWRGCLGLEPSIDQYVEHLVMVFREVWRVLRPDGVAWINLGDSYAGSGQGWQKLENKATSSWERKWLNQFGRPPGYISSRQPNGIKPKDLLGVPWRVAFALQYDGWYLRSEVIWEKPNQMPESVKDRLTKSHEQIFLLSKREHYFFDVEAIKEPVKPDTIERYGRGGMNGLDGNGLLWRNKRTVWPVNTEGFDGPHYALFPTELVKPCLLASTSEKGCCPTCGKQWVRILDKKPSTMNVRIRDAKKGVLEHKTGPKWHASASDAEIAGYGRETVGESRTIGWKPQCNHEGDVVPCTVLDPFGGAGTTALVARQLGRHSVYIDLSRQYADIAIDRLEGQALHLPLLNVL